MVEFLIGNRASLGQDGVDNTQTKDETVTLLIIVWKTWIGTIGDTGNRTKGGGGEFHFSFFFLDKKK